MEYKFRGQRVDNDEWVYGSLVELGCWSYIHTGHVEIVGIIRDGAVIGDQEIDVHYEVRPASVGMFLFDQDQSGEDLYEGDIIKTNTGLVGLSELRKQNLHRAVKWKFPASECYERKLLPYRQFLIIGTIHQSPELLEQA